MVDSRECPDPPDHLVTLALLDPLDPLDPEAPLDPTDPLARTVDLVAMEPSVLPVPADPLDTSDLLAPTDLPVFPDPLAPPAADTTSPEATMSTEPTSLP